MSILLETAIKAAKLAGEILITGFRTSCSMHSKQGIHNLVTEYDLASEKAIIDSIQQQFPNHSILSEEAGLIAGDDSFQWIIDPLDGTVNYAHGIPIFCISIAVIQDGIPVCGVIYAPITNELFYAEHGKGAFLHEQKLQVTSTSLLQDAILVTGFPYNVKDNPGNCIGHFAEIIGLGMPIRRLGSAALDLAYIASGRFDGFWEIDLQSWDIAAGLLLVQEAGGSIVHYDGSPYTFDSGGTILATNGLIEQSMLDAILQADTAYLENK